MEKIKKKLDQMLTLLLVLCVLGCSVFIYQIFSGEEANLFGYRLYHIVTGSMEPTIMKGANVICKNVEETEKLQVGEIIVFRSKDPAIYGSLNTHRIVETGTDENGTIYYITKGDANSRADEYPVATQDICGKVVFYTNASRWFGMFFEFIHTRAGFVTVVIFPLMLVTYFYVRDFVREVNATIAKGKEQKEVEEHEESLEKTEEGEENNE